MLKDILESAVETLTLTGQRDDYVQFVRDELYADSGKFEPRPEQGFLIERLSKFDRRQVVVLKGVQLGVSTIVGGRVLHLPTVHTFKTMYNLPTRDYVKEFVPLKIDEIISRTPYFADFNPRGTFVKKIGFGSVTFQGLQKELFGQSVDFLVQDEVDFANQENLKTARERMEASKLAVHFMFSKPTVQGYGIHEAFEQSDQHFRLFKCKKCGTWNNIVERLIKGGDDGVLEVIRREEKKGKVSYFYSCEKCGKHLDLTYKAAYVPAYPGRDVCGIHMSKIYSTIIPPGFQNIAHQLHHEFTNIKDLDGRKSFWRGKVGWAFAGDEQPLTDAIFNRQAGNYSLATSWPGYSFMGVDVGKYLHCVIGHPVGNRLLLHFFDAPRSEEKIKLYFRNHNVYFGVGDALPEKRIMYKIAQQFPRRFSLLYFKQQFKSAEEDTGEDTVPILQYNRTDVLDAFIDAVKGGLVVFPGLAAGEIIKEVRKHHKKLVKEKRKNSQGQEVWKYKDKCENHYGFAALACYIAWQQWLRQHPSSSGLLPIGGANVTVH